MSQVELGSENSQFLKKEDLLADCRHGNDVSPQEEEKRQEEERIRTENLMMGNPLLQGAADFSVKKRCVFIVG